ncbi:unnamed protein product [Spirodela intermedia]|uniref:Uncharacterized protein n=1 Tax=Spirodela intermedia TaxID=51605 RepID=A0ABN7EBT7_SPIIN|nr:unnamed protein product [Spirodela intermedia]
MVTIRADEIDNIICECIEQYNREVKYLNRHTFSQKIVQGGTTATKHFTNVISANRLQ